tara:strand:- start:357 stop:707 length:351 start_codon:yes stop_codon:yes gene_type:complete
MKSYELIQAVKEKLNLESDNQAAMNIGITRATVSNHKTGKCRTLNDEQCITVAKILGISAEQIIADQHLEGAKTPEERAVWQNILKYAGSAAAVLTGVTLALPALNLIHQCVYYVK